LADAANAYHAFFYSPTGDPDEIRRKQVELAEVFERRDPGSADIALNMLDPQYLLDNDLVLIGSPDTVATKLRRMAEEGSFNTFFGEFNFGNMDEADLLRSIRMFGTDVIPQLRAYEPF